MTEALLSHTMSQYKGYLFSLCCIGSNVHVPLDCFWNGTDKSSILQLQQVQEDKKSPCVHFRHILLPASGETHSTWTPVRHKSC